LIKDLINVLHFGFGTFFLIRKYFLFQEGKYCGKEKTRFDTKSRKKYWHQKTFLWE